MKNKTLLFLSLWALCLAPGVPRLEAQAPANIPKVEPLQMIVTYPDGRQKRRESREDIVDPVGMPIGQPVVITLKFLRNKAGDPVEIVPLDGGVTNVPRPLTISPEGDVSFTFQVKAPGPYRLLVYGPRRYELSLYAVNPAQPQPAR